MISVKKTVEKKKPYIKIEKTTIMLALFSITFIIFFAPINYIVETISIDLVILPEIIRLFIRANYLLIIPLLWLMMGLNKKIKIDVFFVMLFFSLYYIITLLFFNVNIPFLTPLLLGIYYSITGYMIIRAKIIEIDSLISFLLKVSKILFAIIFIVFLFYRPNESEGTYMYFSNAVSLLAMMFIYGAFINRKSDIIFAIVSLILVLIYGSRGGLLSIITYAFIMLVMLKKWKSLFFVAMISLTFLIVLFMPSINNAIIRALDELNIDSRSISMILETDFFNLSARDTVYSYLQEVLRKNFIFGTGLAGDRYYLSLQFIGVNATYAHNIFIELLLHYGVFVGGLIIFFICKIFIVDFILSKRLDNNVKLFIAIFLAYSFIQLLYSRSYLTEYNLFILVALILTYKTSEETYDYGEGYYGLSAA